MHSFRVNWILTFSMICNLNSGTRDFLKDFLKIPFNHRYLSSYVSWTTLFVPEFGIFLRVNSTVRLISVPRNSIDILSTTRRVAIQSILYALVRAFVGIFQGTNICVFESSVRFERPWYSIYQIDLISRAERRFQAWCNKTSGRWGMSLNFFTT